LQHYGFRVLSYSELKKINPELYEICQNCTDDAFTYKKIVAYNENNTSERIRFSLMHELGHFIMDLPSTDKSFEDLADYFASNILVPRATIWHMRSDSVRGICRTYAVSCMAANRIYEDYRMCHLSECKEMNQEIHNWFLPVNIPETPIKKSVSIKQEKSKEKYPKWEVYHEDLERYFPERLQNYVLS
jgi:Zn-dependent peptidase ImmA (M78 family)